MFTWLTRWFSHEPLDLYHPKQRRIYGYWNGREVVHIDPMILYKKVMDVGPELDIDIKLARSISKEAGKGYENMLAKFRKIFDVATLAEGGLTEEETVELFDHFIAYNENQKKSTNSSVTRSTDSATSSPSSARDQITEPSTDCGSTAAAAFTGTPRPSALASSPPSA